MEIPTASALFGEEFEGLEVHRYPVKNGTVYYVQWNDSNPRSTFPRTELKVIFNDGEVIQLPIESEQELKLWTEHLA